MSALSSTHGIAAYTYVNVPCCNISRARSARCLSMPASASVGRESDGGAAPCPTVTPLAVIQADRLALRLRQLPHAALGAHTTCRPSFSRIRSPAAGGSREGQGPVTRGRWLPPSFVLCGRPGGALGATPWQRQKPNGFGCSV